MMLTGKLQHVRSQGDIGLQQKFQETALVDMNTPDETIAPAGRTYSRSHSTGRHTNNSKTNIHKTDIEERNAPASHAINKLVQCGDIIVCQAAKKRKPAVGAQGEGRLVYLAL